MVKKNCIKIFSDNEVIDMLDLYKKDAERLMRQLKAMDRAKIQEDYSEDDKLITKIVHETDDHIVVDEIVFDDNADDIKPEQIKTEVEADKTSKIEIIRIDDEMELKIQYNCSNINWNDVSEILKKVGMAYFEGEVHKKAFENSHTVIFVLDDDKLIGFGRAISDGIYQAAIYDVAVLPEYQGKNLGRTIINGILKCIPQCNFILYASPGKEIFYEKLNFRKMKTGMALFRNAEKMQTRGFVE